MVTSLRGGLKVVAQQGHPSHQAFRPKDAHDIARHTLLEQ